MFTFVQAVALPSATSRAACICGARVRPVRAAPAILPVLWRPVRACAPPTAETEEAPPAPQDPIASTDAPVTEAVPETAEPEAVPEVASPEAVSETAEPEAVADPVAAAPAEDAQKDERREKRKRRRRRDVTLPLEKLEIGMELEGTVKSVTSYGAFIGDMGTPTDGLLHVSQLAANFVENVTDVVQVGDKVKVRVTEVNLEKSNFSLSMKPLDSGGGGGRAERGNRSDSKKSTAKWDVFSYDELKFVDARVSTIADFGAFCQLLDTEGKPLESAPTDGLIHISELSEGRVNNVADIVSVGQSIKVRIVNVDRKRNRISLSMRDYSEQSADRDNTSYAVDVAASNEKQPTLKTSFELAFERVNSKA